MYQPPSTVRILAGDPASVARAKARLADGALADLALHLVARGQQARGGALHRRADGEVGVRDPLQVFPRLRAQRGGTVDHHPAELHLRQAGHLGKAAHGERQALFDAGQRGDAVGIFGEFVVGEDFVGDQRDIALRAECGEFAQFVALHVAAGGVVRIDQHDGARARRERLSPQSADRCSSRRDTPASTGARAPIPCRPGTGRAGTRGAAPGSRRRDRSGA